MAIAIGLLKTLLELSRAKKSGVIEAAAAGARVRLFIEDGTLVHADEGTVGETLGRLLVRERVVSEAEYTRAIERMAELRSKGQDKKLGDVFIELGTLSAEQVGAALSAQVRSKALRALAWSSAETRFIECYAGPLELAGRYTTALEPLVVSALRAADAAAVEALFAQSLGRYPALRTDTPAAREETNARIRALGLRGAERELVDGIDGGRTVSELFDVAGAVDPAVVLGALLLLDCLDLGATPRAPRRPELPRKAPTIRRVAARAPKPAEAPEPRPSAPPRPRPRPSSVHPPPMRTKAEVKNVTSRLRVAREAKRAMPDPKPEPEGELAIPTPQTPVAPVARLLAEKAFQLGKNLVRANQIDKALVELRRAAVLFPAAEYELWAAWAALRTEPSAERTEEARRAAERAVEQDPGMAFAWFVHGHLALRAGDARRAHELFRRAKELEPAMLDDVRDVKFRPAEGGGRAETRGEIRALAPLLTSGPRVLEEQAPVSSRPHLEERTSRPSLPQRASEPAVAAPERTSEPAPERTSAAPSPPPERRSTEGQAMSSRTPTEAKPRPRRAWVAIAGLAIAAAAGVGYRMSRSAGTAATPVLSAEASTLALAADSDAETPTAVTEDAEPVLEIDDEDGGRDPDASIPDDMGALDLPDDANGVRVFVDGKVAGDPPEPILVPCGKRWVRVGANGRDLPIDVPCGGRAPVPYP